MGEKERLLGLFKKVAVSADAFRQDRQEIMQSDKLTDEGKASEIKENIDMFIEASDTYRETMLAIVDEREAGYTAFYVKEAKSRMQSSDYQTALATNLDMLKRGYMGKIEVIALLQLYDKDDLAISRIYETMYQTHSPYYGLMTDRITVKKQLNAFESIRSIINSKVNIGLVDLPGWNATPFDKEHFYFGSGYYAIENELNDDLTINSPDASLALKVNANKKARMPYRESERKKETAVENANSQNTFKMEARINPGTPPHTVRQLTGGKTPRPTA